MGLLYGRAVRLTAENGGFRRGQSDKGCAGGGYAFGPDARHQQFEGVITTSWKRGSIQPVAWGIVANHGGARTRGRSVSAFLVCR
jgi:hypothetical protein